MEYKATKAAFKAAKAEKKADHPDGPQLVTDARQARGDAKSDWKLAKAWLLRELSREAGDGSRAVEES